MITDFIGDETEVVIPEGTTEIAGGVFSFSRSLKSVVIPGSVKKIGKGAFDSCPNLTIYAPAGTAAEKYAKENEIPFEVTNDDEEAPEENPFVDEDPDEAESETSISRDSFKWKGTKITDFIGDETEVVIPEGTTEIGEGAFIFCHSLKSVVIPESVKKIGKSAFRYCPNLTIHAPTGSAAEEYAKENKLPFKAK